jgi:hypothetical protein
MCQPPGYAALAEFGGDAVMSDGLLRAHFFNPVSQFSTTVTGDLTRGKGSN